MASRGTVRPTAPEKFDQTIALQDSSAQAYVHEPDHVSDAQFEYPALEPIQLAGSVSGTDQCTDRCSAQDIWANACLFQRTDDAYVSPAAGGAAAEGKSYARSHAHVL